MERRKLTKWEIIFLHIPFINLTIAIPLIMNYNPEQFQRKEYMLLMFSIIIQEIYTLVTSFIFTIYILSIIF